LNESIILVRREPALGAADGGGCIVHLTLNRPAVRNAMSPAMVTELRDALTHAEGAGDVRVVVLRGAGGHFSVGADLKDLARSPRDPASMAEMNARFGELCVAFANTPLITVAVLEGTVMGGGFGLACVADVAIASETALFRLPETSIGVVPAQIAPFLVERLGYSEGKRLAVTGGRIDARTALALRLVHEVHEASAIDAALARILNDLLQCAPGAVSATKALIARARFTPPAALVQEAAQVFARAATGPEGIEGAMAFVQKRKPKWAP
jgi:isohexenylglutaconyl-CoA hydratase